MCIRDRLKNEYNTFAKSFNLKYRQTEDEERFLIANFSGVVNDFKISIELPADFPIRALKITTKCLNSNNNHFIIRRKKSKFNLQEVLDDDIDINNDNFDEHFFLKSNYPTFLLTILHPENQRLILEANQEHSGKYVFGRPTWLKGNSKKTPKKLSLIHI